MIGTLKGRKFFFLLCILYLIVGFILLNLLAKGEIELFVNRFHNPYLDFIFQYITHLGDGIFSILVIILLFFRKIYFGIVTGIAFLFSSIISQGLKRFVFADTLRPSKFFENMTDLYYIDGITIHSHFSFPSGHTSGAFTIFCCLALFMKNPSLQIIFFLASLAVGFSRIYLLQHFFIDTYFGALIGIVCTLLVYYIIEFHTDLKNKSSLDRPFLSRQ